MSAWRGYRFPPLAALAGAGDMDIATLARQQQTASEAIAHSAEQGYHDGYRSGEQAGRDAGYQHGMDSGRQHGEQAVRAELLARYEHLAVPLAAASRQLQQLGEDYRHALRHDLVELVGKIARQVIRAELSLRPAQLLDLVEEAVAALPPSEAAVAVHLNAEECQRIRELAPERAAQWQLVADAALAPGECRLRRADSEADAGCQQRLDACLARLAEQLQAEGGGA